MTMHKKFTANPPKTRPPEPPRTAADDKRTFDMRPKPTDYKRHDEPQYRAPRHADPVLDDPQGEDSKE